MVQSSSVCVSIWPRTFLSSGEMMVQSRMVRWSDGQMVTSSLSALQLWLLVLARRMRERGGEMPPWAVCDCYSDLSRYVQPFTYKLRRLFLCWGFLSILTMNFNQSHVTSIDKRGSNNWWVWVVWFFTGKVQTCSTAPNGLVEKEPQVMIDFIVLEF